MINAVAWIEGDHCEAKVRSGGISLEGYRDARVRIGKFNVNTAFMNPGGIVAVAAQTATRNEEH